MKVFSLLILTALTSSATAFTMKEIGGGRRDLSGVDKDNELRKLGNKSSKGKQKAIDKSIKSSKGKVKSSKGTNHSDDAPSGPSCDEKCTKYTYYTDAHEVDASFYENAIGFGLAEVPVYDDDARLNQVGTFSSAATIAGAGAGSVQEGVRECIISGALSFDLDEYSGLYGSTINFAYTCNSEYNAVVGGTGAYGCASGYQDFTEISEDGTVTEFDVYICGCLCGTDEKPKIEPLEEIINYPSLYPTLYPTGEPVH